jgi:serine-type D-Ala-D-Ala carboxypeptidase/endopeptidase (penicillin-binding protein 4)
MVRLVASCVVALVCVPLGLAQTTNVGCDGVVALKAGRSGPCTELARTIAGLLGEPGVVRDHWGIAVTSMDGAPIYSLNEGQLFQPASNAKLFTTAAAIALLGPDRTFETKIVARGEMTPDGSLTGNLELLGGGDANLSGRVFPYVSPTAKPNDESSAPDPLRYLAEMADQAVAKGLRVVEGDVVGNDTLFAWEPYASDWALDDLLWGYGAPVSALSVNDNQIKMTIAPGMNSSERAQVTLEPNINYYTIDDKVSSLNPDKNPVGINREPGSKLIKLYGGIAVGAAPDVEELAIQDPAEYAAVALKQMLEARGVVIHGKARAEHWDPHDVGGFLEPSKRIDQQLDFFLKNRKKPLACDGYGGRVHDNDTVLATHVSVPLVEDVVVTNKVSQNLHAEMMLRNIGNATTCTGSLKSGAQAVRTFLLNAGIDKDDFVFFDGSGLSGHDLVTPRATARLLQYASTQPWFADWKKSLPVGGEDGSLQSRFGKAPLKDHVFAKTGTLGEARALSGYLECASGRTVIFSIMVGDHLPGTSKDREAMDKIVAAIAAAN